MLGSLITRLLNLINWKILNFSYLSVTEYFFLNNFPLIAIYFHWFPSLLTLYWSRNQTNDLFSSTVSLRMRDIEMVKERIAQCSKKLFSIFSPNASLSIGFFILVPCRQTIQSSTKTNKQGWPSWYGKLFMKIAQKHLWICGSMILIEHTRTWKPHLLLPLFRDAQHFPKTSLRNGFYDYLISTIWTCRALYFVF